MSETTTMDEARELAGELRRASKAWREQPGVNLTHGSIKAIADLLDELARTREATRRCADIALDEERLYLESSRACDAKGNVHGGTSDIHGALACRRIYDRIIQQFGSPQPQALADDAGRSVTG